MAPKPAEAQPLMAGAVATHASVDITAGESACEVCIDASAPPRGDDGSVVVVGSTASTANRAPSTNKT